MGSRTYEFLAESLLFNQTLVAEEFESVSEQELEKELRRYYDFATKEAATVESEISTDPSNLVVVSDEQINLAHLVQSSLYVNQYVFDDPLLPLVERLDRTADAMNQYLGMKQDDGIDRRKLARVAGLLKSVTPFVAGNFLKLLPLRPIRPAGKPLEINYSPTAYDDALPSEIMKLFREAAVVKSMTKVDRGFRLENGLRPGRAINIDFGDDTGKADFMYLLWKHEVIDMDEKTHIVRGTFTLPDDVPDAAYFDHWLKQSVNQAALELFTRIERQFAFAARLNAVLGSRSELTYRAVQKVLEPQSSIPVHTANTFLNLDLPVLAGVSPEDIMRIRQDEGEAFQRFRLLLDQKLSSIREKDDPAEANRAADYAVHELTQVRMDEIDAKMKGVKEKLATNAMIAGLGLAATVQTAGVGLLSTAVAFATIGKTIFDYRQDVKRHPAFFLWKVLKSKN
ncbi:hypothetical protein [Granulicella sp. S156]|uniref:hypothetical protein n=1 Tax=Granulicella sp. S156 TaxID=1747224 RepID=UPI00131C06CC|nr:hypothetical protein [Granulicella sp. S156]